jgi:hypothetical protein
MPAQPCTGIWRPVFVAHRLGLKKSLFEISFKTHYAKMKLELLCPETIGDGSVCLH